MDKFYITYIACITCVKAISYDELSPPIYFKECEKSPTIFFTCSNDEMSITFQDFLHDKIETCEKHLHTEDFPIHDSKKVTINDGIIFTAYPNFTRNVLGISFTYYNERFNGIYIKICRETNGTTTIEGIPVLIVPIVVRNVTNVNKPIFVKEFTHTPMISFTCNVCFNVTLHFKKNTSDVTETETAITTSVKNTATRIRGGAIIGIFNIDGVITFGIINFTRMESGFYIGRCGNDSVNIFPIFFIHLRMVEIRWEDFGIYKGYLTTSKFAFLKRVSYKIGETSDEISFASTRDYTLIKLRNDTQYEKIYKIEVDMGGEFKNVYSDLKFRSLRYVIFVKNLELV